MPFEGEPDEPERLMPAFTRPAKEKSNNQSKGEESGEASVVARQPQRSSAVPSSSGHLQQQHAVVNDATVEAIDVASDSEPSDSEYQTPSSESAPFFSMADDSVRRNPQTTPGGDAASQRSPSVASTHRSNASTTAQSFVLNDAAYDEASARAAGIPVVSSSDFQSSDVSGGGGSLNPGTPQRKQWNRPQQVRARNISVYIHFFFFFFLIGTSDHFRDLHPFTHALLQINLPYLTIEKTWLVKYQYFNLHLVLICGLGCA